jgi:alpha-tubulin suppressor-like RCC1 family protein
MPTPITTPSSTVTLVRTTCSLDGSKHCIGITAGGIVYSWGNSNAMGQLGRPTHRDSKIPKPVLLPVDMAADPPDMRAYAGGSHESGHSVLVSMANNDVFVVGCDRWQQLGLGSAAGGSSGYTWEGGQIWRTQFVKNPFIADLMQTISGSRGIRDVALGGDHTVILSENQRDVYTFGKGGEGQLGVSGKPFVSAPVRSTMLSSSSSRQHAMIAAVCAVHHCSLTLDTNGEVLNTAGKCRMGNKDVVQAIQSCQERAERDGLLRRNLDLDMVASTNVG